jgi:HD-like signal output (HDOD) protein/CheY-like chemotaxis protein
MKHILFVDDEPKILDGLKRTLRSMRGEWAMAFAGGGQEALEMLDRASFDVVVSDMRMPGMDGARLLDEVRRRFPHIVRIILSGHCDQALIYNSITATHQFLAKPCEVEQLKAVIERACALRDTLATDSLRRLVGGMTTVPSIPALFAEITNAVESNTASLQAIGAIMAKDMGMTAKVLQLANSAYFGTRRSVSTVEQAVMFLGLDTIQTLVLSVHIFSLLPKEIAASFPIDCMWTESMESGRVARAIARAEGRSPLEVEQAYTAGVLHNVGTLVLAANLPDRVSAVLAKASTDGIPEWEAERSEFGVSHAEVGAYLLGLWGLSDPIVEAVAYHHRPNDCVGGEGFRPLTAVHVAQALYQEATQRPGHSSARIDAVYLDRLRMTDRLPLWRQLARETGKEIAA